MAGWVKTILGGGKQNQGPLSTNWKTICESSRSDEEILEIISQAASEQPRAESPENILSAVILAGRVDVCRSLHENGFHFSEATFAAAAGAPRNALTMLELHLSDPTFNLQNAHPLTRLRLAKRILEHAPETPFLDQLERVLGTYYLVTGHGEPLLHQLTLMNQLRLVEYFLAKRTPVEVDTNGVSPLHIAATTGNGKIFHALVDAAPSLLHEPALASASAIFALRTPIEVAENGGKKTLLQELRSVVGSAREGDIARFTHPANMWAMGSNVWSQLNPNSKTKELTLFSPAIFAADEEVQQVACGYFHTLVLLKSGTVLAFGKVNEGQLGNAALPNTVTAVACVKGRQVTAIAAGKYHSAALLLDGSVICWGQSYGPEGRVLTMQNPIVQMACSSYWTYMIDATGFVYASDVRSASDPFKVEGLADIQKERYSLLPLVCVLILLQVACGLFHSVALSAQGDVYMWAEDKAPTRIDFFAGRAVCDVAAGQIRTFALTEAGEVYLWERDPTGEKLVRGPEQVRELADVPVVKIACGDGFTMALAANWNGQTKVYSWGMNNYHQLGRDTNGARDDVPGVVALEGEFNDISCGGFHAVITGGRFQGWRSSLAIDLLAAQQSRFLADFTFKLAGGVTIQIHKLILLARVPSFLDSLGGVSCSETTVPPELNIQPADLLAVLGYLYGGRISVTAASAKNYLVVAIYLQQPTLIRLCRDRISLKGDAWNSLLSSLPVSGVAQRVAQSSDNAPHRLAVGLAPALLNETLSDVAFVVDGVRCPAHRWVVASRCPYFRALWASGMREANLAELPINARKPIFDACLNYLYTESLDGIQEDTCFEVLALASEWQLDRLRNACESFMIQGLDLDNAVSMLQHADTYNAPRLRSAARGYLHTHIKQGKRPEDWMELSEALRKELEGTLQTR